MFLENLEVATKKYLQVSLGNFKVNDLIKFLSPKQFKVMKSKLLRQVLLISKHVLIGSFVQCFFLTVLLANSINGQGNISVEDIEISINLNGTPLTEAFHLIGSKTDFDFIYDESFLDEDKKLTIKIKNKSLGDLLRLISKETDLHFRRVDQDIFVKNKARSDMVILEEFNPGILMEDIIISGKITDENGQGLPGASIVVMGTTIGTVSDAEGNYELNVADDVIVLVSFVGYETQEISVGNQSVIDVQLVLDVTQLEDLVVIGYGKVKTEDLTGSIASISSDEFQSRPLSTVSDMIIGSAAGVNVIEGNSTPGGESIIRIRGGNSMIGSSDPLYIVDGFPRGTIGNANDIESIHILKDASATAIYGSRGANGVIIITTKRGKEGKASLNFEAYYGVQQPRKQLEMLNAQEYVEFANEKASNIGRAPFFPDPNEFPADTDWQDEIFESAAPVANYNLSVTGGNENNKYAITGNYFTQDGIIENTDFSSMQIRTNLDNKITEWFSISTSISALHSVTSLASVRASSNSLVFRALQAPPNAPPFDENGDYFSLQNFPTSDPLWDNPRAMVDGTSDKTLSNVFNGNTNLEFKILEGLKFNVRLGGRYLNSRRDIYLKRIMLEGQPAGQATIFEEDTYGTLYENMLSYEKLFNDKHDLNIIAGFTREHTISSNFRVRVSDFVNDDLGTDNVASASIVRTPSSDKGENTLLSWIGRVNYIFNDKYLFTVTTRADGSSRLGANNKWGIFPSAAIAWKVSEESFMQGLPIISNLKLRTSYGITGNQEIPNYLSLSRLSSVAAIQGVGENVVIGFVPTVLQNEDLKWEVTKQFDIGFDLGLFDQKINLTFDYYNKETSDLLATVPLALSSGFNSIIKNFGDMRNEGIELGINSYIIDNDKWSWSVGANFSMNRNEVLALAASSGQFFGGRLVSPIDASANIIRVGHPLSSMYGFLEDGLWESDQVDGSIQPTAKAGDQKYVDVNNDGLISDADKVILGSPYPDFVFGLNTTLTYKNFSLYVLMQGVQGGLIFNANKFSIGDSFARNGNQLAEVKDRWTMENPNTQAKYPRLSNVGPLVSERFFEDASYLRIKIISLSYNLPGENISWLKNAMIYVSGENLFTITDYTGYDPEVSSTSSSSLIKGVDIGAYPMAKTYTIGLKVSF